jgi:Glycosyl transferase family 2
MTLVVRNEADVLEANLRAHRALGVDAFCVLDNGSTDGTAAILDRWREAGIAHVITDHDANTNEVFFQWPTRLARLAATEMGADWVINNDGDEFWYPLDGDLKDAFGTIPDDVHGLLAPRLEFVPRADGPEPFWERMTLRERDTRVLPKVAHRATDDILVGPGSHHVISPRLGVGETAGKPSLRGLRRKPSQPRLIVPAARFPCIIFHLPLRSLEQYRSRLEIGLRIAGTRESKHLESRINEVIGEDGAEQRWLELIGDEDRERRAIDSGELVRDTRFRDLMRAIGPPDPDALDPAPHEIEATPGGGNPAADQVAEQAIRGLIHNHAQALGERDAKLAGLAAKDRRLRETRARSRAEARSLRAQVRKVRKRARRREDRLARIEGSRWWRLRPRLARRRKR